MVRIPLSPQFAHRIVILVGFIICFAAFFMPFYTYILQSEKNGRRYFGSCENITTRLELHNAGKVRSTKAYIPYKLIYFEEFDTRSEAYKRELFFKTING